MAGSFLREPVHHDVQASCLQVSFIMVYVVIRGEVSNGGVLKLPVSIAPLILPAAVSSITLDQGKPHIVLQFQSFLLVAEGWLGSITGTLIR